MTRNKKGNSKREKDERVGEEEENKQNERMKEKKLFFISILYSFELFCSVCFSPLLSSRNLERRVSRPPSHQLWPTQAQLAYPAVSLVSAVKLLDKNISSISIYLYT